MEKVFLNNRRKNKIFKKFLSVIASGIMIFSAGTQTFAAQDIASIGAMEIASPKNEIPYETIKLYAATARYRLIDLFSSIAVTHRKSAQIKCGLLFLCSYGAQPFLSPFSFHAILEERKAGEPAGKDGEAKAKRDKKKPVQTKSNRRFLPIDKPENLKYNIYDLINIYSHISLKRRAANAKRI